MDLSVSLLDLWLAIMASSFAVFIASSLAHMVLPHHKKDWDKLPDEEALLEFIRKNKVPRGQYMFPSCEDWNDLKDPEKKKHYMAGPHGTIRIWSGMPNMGRNLGLTFLSYIIIGLFVAFLSSMANLQAGSEFMPVFIFTATAAIMAYTFGYIGDTIWYGQPLKPFLNDLADSILFGLLTGVMFALLWPGLPEATLPGVTG
ncbi:MAG: hypothetical protein O7G85_15520 [Planctomycetota bacterium]|nr:hypothetical protein [Planctomycetota bacterium]